MQRVILPPLLNNMQSCNLDQNNTSLLLNEDEPMIFTFEFNPAHANYLSLYCKSASSALSPVLRRNPVIPYCKALFIKKMQYLIAAKTWLL